MKSNPFARRVNVRRPKPAAVTPARHGTRGRTGTSRPPACARCGGRQVWFGASPTLVAELVCVACTGWTPTNESLIRKAVR